MVGWAIESPFNKFVAFCRSPLYVAHPSKETRYLLWLRGSCIYIYIYIYGVKTIYIKKLECLTQIIRYFSWQYIYIYTSHLYDKPPHPPHDRSEPLSLALLGLLRARYMQFLCTFALKCSSWSPVNAGTSGRSACSSLGINEYDSVSTANCMGVRNLANVLQKFRLIYLEWMGFHAEYVRNSFGTFYIENIL